MAARFRLEFAQRTHPGMVRSHNEDAVTVAPEIGLAILADGMGGYNAGEIASGMAIAVLRSGLEASLLPDNVQQSPRHGTDELAALLRAEVAKANDAIFQSASSRTEYSGMGTTLVATLFSDERLTVGHIGDSRLYRLRGNEFKQVTRDHSLLQEQIDLGFLTVEQARLSNNKNLVTRALGVDAAVELEVANHPLEAGDIYLLCSDGLTDMVSDEEIRDTLLQLGVNVELAVETLISMANDNGGRDNVSAILVKLVPENPRTRNIFLRFINWLK